MKSSETHLRTIFASLPEGIIVQNLQGEILEFTANAEKITGLSRAQYQGEAARHPRWKVLNEDGSKADIKALAKLTMATGTPHSAILEVHTAKGSSWVLVKARPIDLTDQPGNAVLTCLTDITELRQAHQDLKEYALKLEQSNRDLQDFAYVASHDLQEPLRMVSSFVHLLEKRYGQTLDEKARSYLHYAVDGAQRMQVLINNLLEYARIDAKDQALRLVSSQAALDQALLNLSMRIEQSKAEISHDELPQVLADEAQLCQIFQNLISNALKFQADEIPRIHIGLSLIEKQEDSFWCFSVSDNGIGIPTDDVERVFTIFQRLHSRDEFEGTGIGLAICRRIITRHGGTIWAESVPGAGTSFHFTLPQQPQGSEDRQGNTVGD